jgi:hypothetical protein
VILDGPPSVRSDGTVTDRFAGGFIERNQYDANKASWRPPFISKQAVELLWTGIKSADGGLVPPHTGAVFVEVPEGQIRSRPGATFRLHKQCGFALRSGAPRGLGAFRISPICLSPQAADRGSVGIHIFDGQLAFSTKGNS